MVSKTLADVLAEESIKFIKLSAFMNELERSPHSKGSNINKVFFLLLGKGLKLHFSEPGYLLDDVKIPNGDVKCALIKGGFQQIITTESGETVQLGRILIGRDNVKQLYSDMGFDTYPWVDDGLELVSIIPMAGNPKNDDTFNAMKHCICQFENEHKRTPTFEELWPILRKSDLTQWDVMLEAKDKQKIKQRYSRYYPSLPADT